MQSSYKVIKNNNINDSGKKEICTDKCLPQGESIISSEYQENFDNIASSILENARKQADRIIQESYKTAQEIENEAYSRGYKTGEEQGYKESYDRAYEEHVLKAQHEAETIINAADEVTKYADSMLLNARHEYEKYFDEKKEEIKALILEISKNVMHKEIKEENALNSMVLNALSEIKNGRTFIIKSNGKYVDELKNSIEHWKSQLTYKCDAFVIEDSTIEPGNVVIEKDNGRIEVGIDVGLSKVKKILEGNE